MGVSHAVKMATHVCHAVCHLFMYIVKCVNCSYFKRVSLKNTQKNTYYHMDLTNSKSWFSPKCRVTDCFQSLCDVRPNRLLVIAIFSPCCLRLFTENFYYIFLVISECVLTSYMGMIELIVRHMYVFPNITRFLDLYYFCGFWNEVAIGREVLNRT